MLESKIHNENDECNYDGSNHYNDSTVLQLFCSRPRDLMHEFGNSFLNVSFYS